MARKDFDGETARGLLAAVRDAISRYENFTGRSAVSDQDLYWRLVTMEEDERLKAPLSEVMDALYRAGQRPSVYGADDREQEYNYFTFVDQVTDAVAQVGLYRSEGEDEDEGTEGQDRESYTDEQDRESYTVGDE